MEISDFINNERNIREAIVVFIPDIVSFNVQLTEEALLSQGCKFTSSDPKTIKSLLDALRSSNIRRREHSTNWDKRQALILRMQDETEVRLILGNTTDGYIGVIKGSGNEDPIQIAADFSLNNDIQNWADRATHIFHAGNEGSNMDKACIELLNSRVPKNPFK